METAFLFDRRSRQNKFSTAEEPVHKDRGAVGRTGLSMEAQVVYNPECTVESWEGLCHPWSPSLQLRAQLVCVVPSHKRQQHAGSSTSHSWLTHLSLHFSSPRQYEGAAGFTGSTRPSFLCAWWGRERELVGKKITGVTLHWKSLRQN